MNVLILHDASAFDGRPDERDALVQADAVASVLRARGHAVSLLGFGLDLEAARQGVLAASCDVVFNLVESVAGQGRLIHLAPALLDAMGVPYTGAPTDAMFLSSHKVWTKRLLAEAGDPTPAWIDEGGAVGGELGVPGRFIVKSVWEDASLGLDDDAVVDAVTIDALARVVAERSDALGGEAFAEAWIEGREFNLALLESADGVVVLPVAEMCFVDFPPDKPRLVGYRAKWDDDSFESTHTVRRFDLPSTDDALVTEMVAIAQRAWTRFGLRGYARVDFRVDAAGRPWVLEINPNPCISPDAGFMAAAGRAGLDQATVVESIVRAAFVPAPRGRPLTPLRGS